MSATTDDGEVMAVRHRQYPVDGIQFHPESVLTPLGPDIGRRFLGRADDPARPRPPMDGRDLIVRRRAR